MNILTATITKPRTTHVLLLVALAMLAGAGLGVTLAAAIQPAKRDRVIGGARVYTASRTRTFAASRIVRGPSATLESFSFTGHGGQATIEWYCGSVGPLRHGGSAEVSLYIDGARSESAFINGRGLFSARPGVVRWLGVLPSGSHVIEVRLEDVRGGVTVPLVAGPAQVQEGVTVQELVAASAGDRAGPKTHHIARHTKTKPV